MKKTMHSDVNNSLESLRDAARELVRFQVESDPESADRYKGDHESYIWMCNCLSKYIRKLEKTSTELSKRIAELEDYSRKDLEHIRELSDKVEALTLQKPNEAFIGWGQNAGFTYCNSEIQKAKQGE